MNCTPIKLPNGMNVIVCGRKPRRPRCSNCGAKGAERECDWKLSESKTCDKPLCLTCRFSPAPEKDLCPTHADAFKQWKTARAAVPSST